MKKKTVGLWMYTNDGGSAIQEKLKERLKDKNIQVVNDFDMRLCYCQNGRVYTQKGFDLSSVDVFYHMNADEQTPYQNDILRALELSGVRVVNSWDAFYTAKNKFMTNVLLKKNGVNVPPSLFINSSQAAYKAEEIFTNWKKIVVKPTSRHAGKGIMAFDSAEKFVDFVDATSGCFESYYIEKFIDFGDHDYRVEIFDGKVVCGYCRHKTHSFKTNISSKGYLIPDVPTQEFEDVALKAAGILGIESTIIDMVRSKENGEIFLLEVNCIMGIFVESFDLVNKIDIYPSFACDEKKIDLLVNYLSCL